MADLSTVVRAAIHPAIGVARVGNAASAYLIGPEVTDPPPLAPGAAKDAAGALKRQAARFRVYGYDAAGKVVAELTADNAEITWNVWIANKKAAWYEFQLAMDIPEVSAARPANRRNATVTGADRAKLVINPGPRSITGRNISGTAYRFDTGTFFGTRVYLGELRTDDAGRLIFLGGRGASASYDNRPVQSFANNDAWRDDIADGSVNAVVKIGGVSIPVDYGWVVVASPNYAPDLLTVRTLYDLLVDVFITAGTLPAPTTVSFTRDVLPILRRMCGLQWVNHGFATRFGWGGPDDFLDPDRLTRLASGRSEDAEMRQQVWNSFRDFTRDGMSPVPWPWIYGDAMSVPPRSARPHVTLTPTQYNALAKWAAGTFLADYDPSATPPRTLADVPVADQPAMLDRAALTFCVADAFHPGCELTWPIRHTGLYRAPFRIGYRPASRPEPDYGDVLTPARALGADGPLHLQGPGDLTRWMAVPWQADTASCRSAYSSAGQGPRYDPYLPTFWPARVPNHVLLLADYQIVIDPAQPADKRRAAFERRASWFRGLTGTPNDQRNQMVTVFGKLGVVEQRPGVADSDEFPPRMLVESTPGLPVSAIAAESNLRVLHVAEGEPVDVVAAAVPEEVTLGYDDKVDRFPGG